MPPRSAKKGGPSPAKRARAVRSTPKVDKAESSPAVEADHVNEAEEEAEEVGVLGGYLEELTPERRVEYGIDLNGSLEEDGMKEAFEEDEDKSERLDFDDNDPEEEYEPEEDPMFEYDKEEDEYVDAHEYDEGDEAEGDVVEGEDGDTVDEVDVEEEVGAEDEIVDEAEEHDAAVDHEEHHDVVKERRKRKEFEVFVGGLGKDTTEDDIRKVFDKVGELVEVRLMMNHITKKNKGFAFLRFATAEQAKRAVLELKNPMINGKQCGVMPSHDNDTLFIGNINKTWTKDTLQDKLKQYGVGDYEDLTLIVDNHNEGMNRGFAFVEFASRSDAMSAFKRLQRMDVFFGGDRNAKISFADSIVEPDDEIMAQVKTIFIDGIPASWEDDQVKKYLNKFGKIEKVELARDMPSARRKDFGFVTFESHDAAVACVEAISIMELGEENQKVKVRARLSRPLMKGRGKHDHRSARGPPQREYSRGLSSRALSSRSARGTASRSHFPSARVRPVSSRDRRPYGDLPDRTRHLPPSIRSYERRPPVAPYHTGRSSRREYPGHEEFYPIRSSRVSTDYAPRATLDRRLTFRDEYSSRGASHPDDARGAARVARRAYVDEGDGRRFEKTHPSFRESRVREFDPLPGSKRPFSSLDEDLRYADPRRTRARVDNVDGYSEIYSDRLGRGYGSSKSSLSGNDTLYRNRHGMGYGGSASSGDVGGIYSSSYSGELVSRERVGGSSYSSLYGGRSAGYGGYGSSSGSGSYY